MICNEVLKTYNMGVYWSISFQIIGAACLVNASFHIDRPPPEIPFQQHFCGKYYMYHILIAAIYRNDLMFAIFHINGVLEIPDSTILQALILKTPTAFCSCLENSNCFIALLVLDAWWVDILKSVLLS